jgi:hypothetical protein
MKPSTTASAAPGTGADRREDYHRVHLAEAAGGIYSVWPYRFDGLSRNWGLQLSGKGLRRIPR